MIPLSSFSLYGYFITDDAQGRDTVCFSGDNPIWCWLTDSQITKVDGCKFRRKSQVAIVLVASMRGSIARESFLIDPQIDTPRIRRTDCYAKFGTTLQEEIIFASIAYHRSVCCFVAIDHDTIIVRQRRLFLSLNYTRNSHRPAKMSVRPDSNFKPIQDMGPAAGWAKVRGLNARWFVFKRWRL